MKEPAMLERGSRFCYHRRRLVVAVWIALLIGLTAFGQSVGSAASDSFKLGGTESARAQNLLRERFPARSGASGFVVFEAAKGVQDPQTKADVTAVLERIKTQPRIAGITSPYD